MNKMGVGEGRSWSWKPQSCLNKRNKSDVPQNGAIRVHSKLYFYEDPKSVALGTPNRAMVRKQKHY